MYICKVRLIIPLIFIFTSQFLFAQESDSGSVSLKVRNNKYHPDSLAGKHSPKKATIFSAILPGSGQIYNGQTWKAVLVYSGFSILGYYIYDNNKIYKDYLQQWIYLTDGDSLTRVRPELERASPDALHNAFSAFRKYRDQCIMGFALLYAANIIDANVYAHLYHFNVDDLSFHLTPGIILFHIHSLLTWP